MAQYRRCRKCGREKPLVDFPIYDRAHGWRRHECRVCYMARMNATYLKQETRWRAQSKARYERRPSALWTREEKDKINARTRRYSAERLAIVLDHYGGKCACCGEANPGFLTIDHVNNDGWSRRKEHGLGISLYRWLIKNNFPEDFQVLCYNCNFGKNRNGGVCPHQSHGRLNDHPFGEYAASDRQRKRSGLASRET